MKDELALDDLLLEIEARRLWDERETVFPGFSRMKWEHGTPLARYCTILAARRNLRVLR